MEILKTLIALDIQEGRRWFAKERLWRIVVAILFLMVIAFVSISIGGMSRYYFTYLRTFEEFGELTIDYVLRASVLVVFWIGTLSSLFSGLAFLLTPNKKIDQILTTPTSPFIVSLLHTIKAMAGNLLIFIPLLFPVLFSNHQMSDTAEWACRRWRIRLLHPWIAACFQGWPWRFWPLKPG